MREAAQKALFPQADVRPRSDVLLRAGVLFAWAPSALFDPIATAQRRANRMETFAKRFAAKEACAKALGTGFRAGVFFRDLGVVNLPSGRPTMKLTGGAQTRLAVITPPGWQARIDVTLTDEGPLAQAFVIISAEALPGPGSPASNP